MRANSGQQQVTGVLPYMVSLGDTLLKDMEHIASTDPEDMIAKFVTAIQRQAAATPESVKRVGKLQANIPHLRHENVQRLAQ